MFRTLLIATMCFIVTTGAKAKRIINHIVSKEIGVHPKCVTETIRMSERPARGTPTLSQ